MTIIHEKLDDYCVILVISSYDSMRNIVKNVKNII